MTNIFILSSHFKHFNAISFGHMINDFDVERALNHYPTNKKIGRLIDAENRLTVGRGRGFGKLDEKGKGIKQNKLVVTE